MPATWEGDPLAKIAGHLSSGKRIAEGQSGFPAVKPL